MNVIFIFYRYNINVLRLEEQGVTLNADLIKFEKKKKKKLGSGGLKPSLILQGGHCQSCMGRYRKF